QAAALAAVVDRKREVRCVKDRHALDLELHVPRGAEALLEVELDLGPVEPPRPVAFRACREEERRQRQPPLGAADDDVLARSARGPRRNLEAGLAEENALVEPVEDRVLPVDARLGTLVE